MIITSTENIAHFQISEYIGTVYSNIVMGTNIFSDIAASFTDFFRCVFRIDIPTIYETVGGWIFQWLLIN